MVHRQLGTCGTETTHRTLHVLVGEPVDVCPIVTADEEVRTLAELLPGPGICPGITRPGLLTGVPLLDMPPRYRDWFTLGEQWAQVWAVKTINEARARSAAAQNGGG